MHGYDRFRDRRTDRAVGASFVTRQKRYAGLEPVINFPAGGVADVNRARQGGGRRLWLFQG
jgi:hypothetical protein